MPLLSRQTRLPFGSNCTKKQDIYALREKMYKYKCMYVWANTTIINKI
jgi:hypothetical protein